MKTSDIELERPADQAVKAYAVTPDAANAPGVVVIHEIWGVDAHIRSVADRLGEAGFAVIAPDLIGMEVTISKEVFMQAYGALQTLSPEERAVPEKVDAALSSLKPDALKQVKVLMGVIGKGPSAEGLAVIDAAIARLKAQGAAKVGVMGFCLGGGYSWAHAYAGGHADAYSPWYGRLPADLDPTKVNAAIDGHFGADDEGIPVEPLQQAAASLRAIGKEAAIHVYAAAGHAFFNETRDTYRPEASAEAWHRQLAFFREHLG